VEAITSYTADMPLYEAVPTANMKTSLVLFCVCALYFSTTRADYVEPGEPVYLYNVTIVTSGDGQDFTYTFNVNNGSIYVGTVPCYGQYNWYAAYGIAPTTTENNFAQPWSAGKSWSATYQPSSALPYNVSMLAVGTASYNGISAVYDVIASTEDPQVYLIPQPGAGGSVKGTLSSDGKSGTLTWTTTNNDNDTYQLFYRDGNPTDGGYYPYTACGIKRFFSPFTSDQGSFQKNNDNTYTANIKNLNSKNPFSVTVVAQRPGAYQVAYDTFVFNGASLVGVSVIGFAMVIFSLFL